MKCTWSATAALLLLSVFGVRAEADELVVNGGFSAGNSGFTSNYALVTGGSTSPGQYGVVSNPATAFTNGYASYGDHTTGAGLMLFGDGSPGTVLWSQTVAVVPGTSYSFSAWVTAAIGIYPPVVRFSANGTPLGPDMQVSAVAGAWQNFTATYASGASSSVTLRIEDVLSAPTGNDFTVDDISLATVAPCNRRISGRAGGFGISADSSRVVYFAEGGLYSVPISGGAPTKLNGALVPGGAVSSPEISANSSRVVYTADGLHPIRWTV